MAIEIPPNDVILAWRIYILEFILRVISLGDGIEALTSFYRNPEKNRQVGGHPQSQHLIGTAIDVRPRGTAEAFVGRARDAGLVAVNEGDHVHLQLFDAGTPRPERSLRV